MVAPPVGAWIETARKSHAKIGYQVAPPVGAWIETFTAARKLPAAFVAPPVGAWIETRYIFTLAHARVQSLPPWERGLKQIQDYYKFEL